MNEPPKSVREPVLSHLGTVMIGVISIASAVVGLILFGHNYAVHHDPVLGRSFSFALFAVNSMVYIFAYRSLRRSLFHSGHLSRNKALVGAVAGGLVLALGAFAVPAIRNLLGIVPLGLMDWLRVFVTPILLLTVVEIGKWLGNRQLKRSALRRASDEGASCA